MNERILPIQFDLSSAPRIIPIEKKESRVDQRILTFAPLYEDVCREIYLKYRPLPKDIWNKVGQKFPDLHPLLETVSKSENFRLAGGEMATMSILDQLKNVGQSPMAFFLMRDVVSAKMHDHSEAVCGYTINELNSCGFGADIIQDSLRHMGVSEGPNSFEAKQLNFVDISKNVLNNPHFNHQKMI